MLKWPCTISSRDTLAPVSQVNLVHHPLEQVVHQADLLLHKVQILTQLSNIKI
jgi:hypothetical protein